MHNIYIYIYIYIYINIGKSFNKQPKETPFEIICSKTTRKVVRV